MRTASKGARTKQQKKPAVAAPVFGKERYGKHTSIQNLLTAWGKRGMNSLAAISGISYEDKTVEAPTSDSDMAVVMRDE